MPKADNMRMHKAYETLMKKTGGRSRPSDPAVFETFIRAHHNALRHRYGCSRVAFSLKRKDGKPLLFAAPVVH
jgi:hypothetical protein